MQLVFIHHGSFTHYFALSHTVSVLVLVGGLYGSVRLVIDAWRMLRYGKRSWSAPPTQ